MRTIRQLVTRTLKGFYEVRGLRGHHRPTGDYQSTQHAIAVSALTTFDE